MTGVAPKTGFSKNLKLKNALLQHKALSPSGMSERLFGVLFSGLVYPQIWEDPDVDMQAMELRDGHSIVTIGSGGCNVLTYLSRNPARIDVVDLNPHHIALNKLKLAAFRHLPNHGDVVRQFGVANVRSNSDGYDRFIAPHLDPQTRAYWSKRTLTGRRRISVFNRNIYRTGLLGRFIGAGHVLARLHGVKLQEMAKTRSLDEQRQFFDQKVAPLFDKPMIRWLTKRKSSLFGLGILPGNMMNSPAFRMATPSRRCCASVLKNSPATFRSRITTSHGRLLRVATRRLRKAICPITCAMITTRPFATMPRGSTSITPPSRNFWLPSPHRAWIVMFCSMRRTG